MKKVYNQEIMDLFKYHIQEGKTVLCISEAIQVPIDTLKGWVRKMKNGKELKDARFGNSTKQKKFSDEELKQIELRNSDGEIVLGLDGNPVIKEKGNLDIELTMDVMQKWNYFDIMVLFSGDSDFYPLVSFLQFKGKKVYVFSTVNNISSELMHHSNKYYDFCEIDEIWGSKLKHRNEKS